MVEGRKPGKALDVAMGQGRNSHYLATHGWDVTGYDISEGGLTQARQLAEKAGLKIRTVTASHEEFYYGTAQWDPGFTPARPIIGSVSDRIVRRCWRHGRSLPGYGHMPESRGGD
jgi:cyclopropane fatty-acyl-phospholipid synthase-like methyltransferase